MASLDEVTASYLGVYREGLVPPQRDFARELDDPAWDLDGNARLWRLDPLVTKPYNPWICRLAFALLIRSHAPFLRSCSQMVTRTFNS